MLRRYLFLLSAAISCGPGTTGPAAEATSGGSTGTSAGSGGETGWPNECVGLSNGRVPCYRVVPTGTDPADGVSAVADLDGDGWSDLLDRQSNLWFGEGEGLFAPRVPLPPPGKYGSLLGDLNRDGLGDVVALVSAGELAVYRGTSEGVVFTETVMVEVPASFGHSLGDFDGDDDLDVLTWDRRIADQLAQVQRIENDSSGALTPGLTHEWSTTAEPYPRVVGDVDGDGADDVVGWFPIPFDNSPNHVVYGGPDALAGPYILPGPEAHQHLADVDGDGKADLVYSRPGSIEIWHTLGRNAFETWGTTELFVPIDQYTTGSVAMADVDGDDAQDLLVTAVDVTPDGRELSVFILFDPSPQGFGQVERLTIPTPCPSNLESPSLYSAVLDPDPRPDFLLSGVTICNAERDLVALIPQ